MSKFEGFERHAIPIGDTGTCYTQTKEIPTHYIKYTPGFRLPNGIVLRERLCFVPESRPDLDLFNIYGTTIKDAEAKMRVYLIMAMHLSQSMPDDEELSQVVAEISSYFTKDTQI